MKEEIGFIHGMPEPEPAERWQKEINGKTFTFLKERVRKNGIILYNCSQYSENERFTSASSTGFHSNRNLTPEEVERLPQFAGFIADCARFAFPPQVNRR
jgi:hypothetical protein